MENFHRAARNQIATSLNENAMMFGHASGCKWSKDLQNTARRILLGGIITPYDVCHSCFSNEKIARAAISMCVEHYPRSGQKISELDDGKFVVSLWN